MDDSDQDALAAEYVLGTLSSEERDQAEAMLAVDQGFAEAVRQWERRLGELNVMVEAIEPPPAVWNRLSAEIGAPASGDASLFAPLEDATLTAPTAPSVASDTAMPSPLAALASTLLPPDIEPSAKPGAASSPVKPIVPPPAAPPPRIERNADTAAAARARRWRGCAVALGAIAVLLALFIAISALAPNALPPEMRLAQGRLPRTPAPAVVRDRLVAVLQQEPIAPAFLVTVDGQSRMLTVRRVAATPVTGHSYQLWLMSKQSTPPRSLGLIGADEFTQRALPAGVDTAAVRGASYEVSLEPTGGSQSGAPSGPILFTGTPVETLPVTPPASSG